MPLIRVLKDNDEPLYFSSGQVRHLDQAATGDPAHPDARSILLFDRGDGSGLMTAWLKTSAETVAELVRGDSAFYGRLVDFEAGGGVRIYLLPQHLNGLEGLTPPSDEELAKAEAAVSAAVIALEGLAEDDKSADAEDARRRVATLQAALEGRRSFVGLHTRIDLAIPARQQPIHCTYYLVNPVDEVAEALEPPKPQRPGVDAQPVRADRGPKPAKLKPPARARRRA